MMLLTPLSRSHATRSFPSWLPAITKKSWPFVVAAVVVAAVVAVIGGGADVGNAVVGSAVAQESDRRDRDRDRDRRRFDPKDYIGRMDENGNGVLEPSEISSRSRYFLEGAAKDAGLDLSRDVPVAKMIEAMEKRNAAREAASGSSGSSNPSSGSSSGSASGSSTPSFSSPSSSASSSGSSGGSSSGSSGGSKSGFPGFGEKSTVPKPPGFDVPLAPRTTSGATASSTQYDRRVIEYVDKMMVDFDLNKDGVLDKGEIEKAPWQSDPKESDLNKDGRLDREELNQRIARRFGYLPRSSSTTSGSTGSTGSGGSSSGSGDASRVRAYAEGLLKQNDANKNGVLDKDEWANVRSITRDTDANNDGTVTLDELTTKLGSYGRDENRSGSGSSSSSSTASSGSSSSGSSSGGSSSGGGSSGYRSSSGSGYGSGRGDAKQTGEKRSYRQRTVAERMPKGLPDWFARNDEDADGQITMAEYATLWSDTKAAEFAKFDLDGDGVITPRECLRSQELETKRK